MPRELKTAVLLFSFALLFILVRGIAYSAGPVGKTMLLTSCVLGIFGTPIAILFYGLKWGDQLSLCGFRVFLSFCLAILILLNYSLFINGGSMNQIINHSIVTGLLFVSLCFGFTKKVKDWSYSNGPAY